MSGDGAHATARATASDGEAALSGYVRASGWLGRAFRYHTVTASTNDVALAAADAGAPEGLVVVADVQTAGRGRLTRLWEAPAGSSLLVSLLFRPPAPLSAQGSRVTMLCGLGLQTAVRAVCGLETRLKWPNDLIFEPPAQPEQWLKLGGMLSEVALGENGRDAALVVGMGLNVNIPPAQLGALAPNAGSLSALTDKQVSRVALLDALLNEIECRYEALLRGVDPVGAWQAQLAWQGRPVAVNCGTTVVQGILVGVDDQGCLNVRVAGGTVRTFSAGDVSLRLL
jgi:BirA family transcriptional regulator, biotin operon repressor / biotin---[acetyl-CoA-carboxylase] ligase